MLSAIAIEKNSLQQNPCVTKELMLNGHDKPVPATDISSLSKKEMEAALKTSVQEEMCMTVEDFLSRRTRQLLLNASEAIKAAPLVAKLMADRKSVV